MGTFKSSRTFPYGVKDIEPVAQDVMSHFEEKNFEVTGKPIAREDGSEPTGGWQISVRKGGIFRTVSGLKTALNIRIEPAGNGTTAEASIGVFGAQALPTVIMLFVFWPIVFAQVWGLAQSHGLDEEALSTVKQSLEARSQEVSSVAEGDTGAAESRWVWKE